MAEGGCIKIQAFVGIVIRKACLIRKKEVKKKSSSSVTVHRFYVNQYQT